MTVGDTQGEECLITVMLKKNKTKTTMGMCFLVDMADRVCNGDAQTYSIYIYKTCWYTLLSTFTLPFPENNKTSHKEAKTIYTFKQRRVEASRGVLIQRPIPAFIHPATSMDPTVHNATSWRGGWKSASVLCTTVPAVRISSFSLECFNTRRNISLH